MLRAIAHASFCDHPVDLACEGCLEVLGFATVRGYDGNTHYPTCGEALGRNDAYDAYEPIGGARATDRHQQLDCDSGDPRDSDGDSENHSDSHSEPERASLPAAQRSITHPNERTHEDDHAHSPPQRWAR